MHVPEMFELFDWLRYLRKPWIGVGVGKGLNNFPPFLIASAQSENCSSEVVEQQLPYMAGSCRKLPQSGHKESFNPNNGCPGLSYCINVLHGSALRVEKNKRLP